MTVNRTPQQWGQLKAQASPYLGDGSPNPYQTRSLPAAGNAGAQLVGKTVRFELRHSDQATAFNEARHGDTLTGDCVLAYDSYVVVIVPGWRFGHTVTAAYVSPEDQQCVRCSAAVARGVCCSSHGKPLCHRCYRRTHFVEVCVEGCADCDAEGLPVILGSVTS